MQANSCGCQLDLIMKLNSCCDDFVSVHCCVFLLSVMVMYVCKMNLFRFEMWSTHHVFVVELSSSRELHERRCDA
jgi:hypothetical protein